MNHLNEVTGPDYLGGVPLQEVVSDQRFEAMRDILFQAEDPTTQVSKLTLDEGKILSSSEVQVFIENLCRELAKWYDNPYVIQQEELK